MFVANVYVDGFNLYYGALKGTPYKWLDIAALCRHIFPDNTVNRIRYFTATVEVIKTEEKGSDVNLATWLLLDAFHGEYEAAIVVSNDSDLAEPVYQVRKEFGVKVVVLHPLRAVPSPQKPHPNYDLVKAATKSVILTPSALQLSQFPPSMNDAHGDITKPVSW